MHWENLGALAPVLPALAVVLLVAAGAMLIQRYKRRQLAGSERKAIERYWALELAHRAKMQALEWVRGSKTRQLTWQPGESDADLAALIAAQYEGEMSDLTFENRLARARFRAWHRGTREADYTLGGFYDRYHAEFSEADLAWFEAVLEEDDSEILAWAMGTKTPPEQYRGTLMAALQKLDYVTI